MNVTKDGFKGRQLHIEDYLQMIPAEQGEYAEASVCLSVALTNKIIAKQGYISMLDYYLKVT